MTLRQTFAASVRAFRKAKGLSQEQLAFEAGLHRTYISSIERSLRNVSIDNIEVIRQANPARTGSRLLKMRTGADDRIGREGLGVGPKRLSRGGA